MATGNSHQGWDLSLKRKGMDKHRSRRKRKRKFPIYVKAQVINPLGAAAKKGLS